MTTTPTEDRDRKFINNSHHLRTAVQIGIAEVSKFTIITYFKVFPHNFTAVAKVVAGIVYLSGLKSF